MIQEANAEELNAIFEMFEASVDGQMYDVERFGAYYPMVLKQSAALAHACANIARL